MFITCSQYKAKEEGGSHPRPPSPPFLHVNKCKTLLSEQDISLKKYIAFSELVILVVGRAATVT